MGTEFPSSEGSSCGHKEEFSAFHEIKDKTSDTIYQWYIHQCFLSVNCDDTYSQLCTLCINIIFSLQLVLRDQISDIEDKIWGENINWPFQNEDNIKMRTISIWGQYQLALSVTLSRISLTIWFARSKLLVLAPISFSLLLVLLTFTFLDFLSRAFFACASFNFLSCQARCLCRTIAMYPTCSDSPN